MTDESVVEAPAEQEKPNRPKNFLDFDDLPPEIVDKIKPRFTELYKGLKRHEEITSATAEHARRLEAEIAELRTTKAAESQASELATLRAQHVNALEKADYRTATLVSEKIADIKVKNAERAVAKPDEAPSKEVLGKLRAWQFELNDGGYVRPWAVPGHPDAKNVADLLSKLQRQNPDASVDEILETAERIVIDTKKQRKAATVMDGEDVTPSAPKKSATKLNESEKRASWNLYPDMPKLDAEKRYSTMKAKSANR